MKHRRILIIIAFIIAYPVSLAIADAIDDWANRGACAIAAKEIRAGVKSCRNTFGREGCYVLETARDFELAAGKDLSDFVEADVVQVCGNSIAIDHPRMADVLQILHAADAAIEGIEAGAGAMP
jgi:hypothetical protein